MSLLVWAGGNTLEREELRKKLRDKKSKMICNVVGCNYPATDIHHRDENHSNNAPENLAPACKPCHNFEHGISAQMSDVKLVVRLFYEAQKQRMAAESRARAYEALRIHVPQAVAAVHYAEEYEKALEKSLIAMMEKEPFYQRYLSRIKGIGPKLSAMLIAEIGSPTRFKSVTAFWNYCLGPVRDGKVVRAKKGENHTWNPRLKMTAWKIASQFVKTNGCFGRALYDHYKDYYIKRDGPEPAWKPHRRALRRAAKDFLRCFWVAWMQILGESVSPPRQKTWPMPEDWIEDR